jgi:inhibitor of cysteine peptidase
VTLGEKDAGRTVELRAGQALEITLPGNPTTGYLWEVASVDAAVLKAVGEPQFKADSSAVGSGGQITLRFEAASAGQTALQLIYHRSFEKDVPPAKTFEVTVVVK